MWMPLSRFVTEPLAGCSEAGPFTMERWGGVVRVGGVRVFGSELSTSEQGVPVVGDGVESVLADGASFELEFVDFVRPSSLASSVVGVTCLRSHAAPAARRATLREWAQTAG